MNELYLIAIVGAVLVIAVMIYIVYGGKLRKTGADRIIIELLMILGTSLDKIDQKKFAKEVNEVVVAIRVSPMSTIDELYDVVAMLRDALDDETLAQIDQKIDELYETGVVQDAF